MIKIENLYELVYQKMLDITQDVVDRVGVLQINMLDVDDNNFIHIDRHTRHEQKIHITIYKLNYIGGDSSRNEYGADGVRIDWYEDQEGNLYGDGEDLPLPEYMNDISSRFNFIEFKL